MVSIDPNERRYEISESRQTLLKIPRPFMKQSRWKSETIDMPVSRPRGMPPELAFKALAKSLISCAWPKASRFSIGKLVDVNVDRVSLGKPWVSVTRR